MTLAYWHGREVHNCRVQAMSNFLFFHIDPNCMLYVWLKCSRFHWIDHPLIFCSRPKSKLTFNLFSPCRCQVQDCWMQIYHIVEKGQFLQTLCRSAEPGTFQNYHQVLVILCKWIILQMLQKYARHQLKATVSS